MQILERVLTHPNICKIQLAFNGVLIPSNIEGWQPFFNSLFPEGFFEKTYAGLSSLDFAEESETVSAGTYYKQKILFRFPTTDDSRAERIALMQKITYVSLTLNNGLIIVVGRNDWSQNTVPTVKTKTNHNLCEVEVASQSIFPSGFTPNLDDFGLPTLVPINLI